jgi:hypothetical protein
MPNVHDHHFTLAEAEALLPRVKPLVDELVGLKSALDDKGYDIHRHRYFGGIGPNGDRAHPPELDRLVEILRTIDTMGVVVKGIDQGLIDFPALRANGEEVYLCYQAGEVRIRWWHPIDVGFAGRRPIAEL